MTIVETRWIETNSSGYWYIYGDEGCLAKGKCDGATAEFDAQQEALASADRMGLQHSVTERGQIFLSPKGA